MSKPSIEQIAMKNFHNNLEYFQKEQPRVYEKITAFENAVANGYYQEQYELEYKDEGYFDVKEKSTSNYLYGTNSNEYAKALAKSVDYRKEDNIFIVSPRFEYSKEYLKNSKNDSLEENGIAGIAYIIDFINKKLPKDSTMTKLEKYIFFGVGLGLHVKEIDKKINSDFYLLVEDDLELFRLSMFVTDYSKLARHSSLYFCIFEEDSVAKTIMTLFLEDGFMHNHYIKFLQTLHLDESKIRTFQEVVASQTHQLFPYHAYFKKYLTPLEHLKNGYKFLNLNSDIFKGKKVLLLAAGPSLEKNLKWVKEHHKSFITIALTSTLGTLEKEGIIPDIITHLDPFKEGSLPHLQRLKNKDYFKKPICLFGSQTPPELVEMFDKKRVFIFENGTSYKKGFGSVTATCVGSMSYAISLALGSSEIYLLGLDLAIDEKSGSTHTSTHSHREKLDLSRLDKLEKEFSFKKSLIKVKGNFKDEVLTTPNFYMSIENIIINNSKNKKDYQKVYNLSDGAFFANTIPTKIEDIVLKDDCKKETLFKEFLDISSDELTYEEVESIKSMYQHSQKIKDILSRHRLKKYKTKEEYQYSLMSLSLDITADRSIEASFLNIVLLRYMQYIYPYIFDFLNTKEIKYSKESIKHIDTLLVKYMKKIVEVFEVRLEYFLTKECVA